MRSHNNKNLRLETYLAYHLMYFSSKGIQSDPKINKVYFSHSQISSIYFKATQEIYLNNRDNTINKHRPYLICLNNK